MSIIHDALKKARRAMPAAEKPDEVSVEPQYDQITPPDIKLKKNNILPLLFFGTVVCIIILYAAFKVMPGGWSMPYPSIPNIGVVRDGANKEALPRTNFLPKNNKAASAPPALPRPANFILNGIMYIEDGPQAIINGYIVKQGDFVNGAKVADIQRDNVSLDMDGNKINLKLVE